MKSVICDPSPHAGMLQIGLEHPSPWLYLEGALAHINTVFYIAAKQYTRKYEDVLQKNYIWGMSGGTWEINCPILSAWRVEHCYATYGWNPRSTIFGTRTFIYALQNSLIETVM